MISEQLKIYKRTKDFAVRLLEITKNLDRFTRGVVGTDMMQITMRELIARIVRVNKQKSIEKRIEELDEFIINLETVKAYLRVLSDAREISLNNMAELSSFTDDIGKQATGWKKYLNDTLKNGKKEFTENELNNEIPSGYIK